MPLKQPKSDGIYPLEIWRHDNQENDTRLSAIDCDILLCVWHFIPLLLLSLRYELAILNAMLLLLF
jgi:hypothetical protein